MYPRLSLAETGWYHSFELPDGRRFDGLQSVEQLSERWRKLNLPEDLRGRRALDIGTWDGWFAFELERRGAEVLAIDTADVEGFRLVHKALDSRVERRLLSVYELGPAEVGRFDIVLFQGVLYHLKHPLLALEKVCSVATDAIRVESFVSGDADESPRMEFYERSELRGQFDNWVGPNVQCLLAMCRTAGLTEVELIDVEGARALVSCGRHWPPAPDEVAESAPVLLAVSGATSNEEELALDTEEYAALYFKSDESDLTEEDVFPTVGEFATSAAELRSTGGDGWTAVCRIPPGLGAGPASVTVRTRKSSVSNAVSIPVVGAALPKWLPAKPGRQPLGEISIAVVADGKTWSRNVLESRDRCLSLWVRGLAEDVGTEELHVCVGTEAAEILFLSGRMRDQTRQVNLRLPLDFPSGRTTVAVGCRGAVSERAPLDVVSPAI